MGMLSLVAAARSHRSGEQPQASALRCNRQQRRPPPHIRTRTQNRPLPPPPVSAGPTASSLTSRWRKRWRSWFFGGQFKLGVGLALPPGPGASVWCVVTQRRSPRRTRNLQAASRRPFSSCLRYFPLPKCAAQIWKRTTLKLGLLKPHTKLQTFSVTQRAKHHLLPPKQTSRPAPSFRRIQMNFHTTACFCMTVVVGWISQEVMEVQTAPDWDQSRPPWASERRTVGGRASHSPL